MDLPTDDRSSYHRFRAEWLRKIDLVGELLRITSKPLRVSISATTRPARRRNGWKTLPFLDTRTVRKRNCRGSVLEHAFVHGDHHYGTPRGKVEPYLHKGIGVILVIDVQGAEQVREDSGVFSIFIRVPGDDCLPRLKARGDPEDAIRRRLLTAAGELARDDEYSVQLVNDDLKGSVAEMAPTC